MYIYIPHRNTKCSIVKCRSVCKYVCTVGLSVCMYSAYYILSSLYAAGTRLVYGASQPARANPVGRSHSRTADGTLHIYIIGYIHIIKYMYYME